MPHFTFLQFNDLRINFCVLLKRFHKKTQFFNFHRNRDFCFLCCIFGPAFGYCELQAPVETCFFWKILMQTWWKMSWKLPLFELIPPEHIRLQNIYNEDEMNEAKSYINIQNIQVVVCPTTKFNCNWKWQMLNLLKIRNCKKWYTVQTCSMNVEGSPQCSVKATRTEWKQNIVKWSDIIFLSSLLRWIECKRK